METNKLYLYPVWVRLWHITNALMCLALILSGVSMQYSNPEFPFIRFDIAVSMHNISGIILSAMYVMFFVGNWSTSNGKHYRIRIRGLLNSLIKQARYYAFGIFKGEKPPFPVSKEMKFNPLQKFTYALTMYFFVPLVFITGWALLFPGMIITNVFGFGGIQITSLLHVTAGFLISLFLIIHIYFCTIGHSPSSNFKSMINGYHEPH
ncbi:MAG: cytochrome b/b6 domain-containing protein [Bacteroidales bacterium]|nr:cytochrome b/b6 domain-containing protein [Bacteroidales bacterium]